MDRLLHLAIVRMVSSNSSRACSSAASPATILSFALDGQLHELAKGLSGPSGLAVSPLSVICAASCDDDLAWLQRRPQRCSRSVDVAPNLRRSAAFTRPY